MKYIKKVIPWVIVVFIAGWIIAGQKSDKEDYKQQIIKLTQEKVEIEKQEQENENFIQDILLEMEGYVDELKENDIVYQNNIAGFQHKINSLAAAKNETLAECKENYNTAIKDFTICSKKYKGLYIDFKKLEEKFKLSETKYEKQRENWILCNQKYQKQIEITETKDKEIKRLKKKRKWDKLKKVGAFILGCIVAPFIK